jgi:site-specific DNA-methyltransferase (adenine-specific)
MSDADREVARVPQRNKHGYNSNLGDGSGRNDERFEQHAAGRWPTNVVLDETQAAELDKQSGTLTSGPLDLSKIAAANKIYGTRPTALTGTYPADSGGASRFYPVFKYQPKAPATERQNHDGTSHPTVKPVDLMRWLIRLVTPPGGTILDPFAGSGTTGEAAIKEHKHAILIEREDTYVPLIVARLCKPMAIGFNFDEESA